MKQNNNFTLRLPDDLRVALEKRAKKENRSLSNLILTVLKESIDKEPSE